MSSSESGYDSDNSKPNFIQYGQFGAAFLGISEIFIGTLWP